MWRDVIDLRDFYGLGLGHVVRREIRTRIRALWPNTKGYSVLGVGYTTPYLGPFRSEATRAIAAMPAEQGVLHWPDNGAGLTTLIDEMELPFPDLSMDRVLLVHALESSEQVRPLLREIWRVMSASGRLIIVAPNRRGIWARFERTPFGHGLPYSTGQLSRLLRDNMFTPTHSEKALYIPPVHSRMMHAAAPAWEQLGQQLFNSFGGVVIAEATKQIYAGNVEPVKKPRRRYVTVPESNSGAQSTDASLLTQKKNSLLTK
jgi:SAM-dependent methyltransferase